MEPDIKYDNDCLNNEDKYGTSHSSIVTSLNKVMVTSPLNPTSSDASSTIERSIKEEIGTCISEVTNQELNHDPS